jgi:ankyrin repeat protein
MLAVQAWDHAAVDLLLEYNDLRASQCNAYGQTALSMAITQGSVSIVRQLLRRKDIEFYSPDRKVQQPLLVALEYQQYEILQILSRDSRAKINQKDHSGRTILHLAVIYGDLHAVVSLARKELIDVDCPDHLGEMPLTLAAKLHVCGQPNNVKIHKCLLSRSKVRVHQDRGVNLSFICHEDFQYRADRVTRLRLNKQ